MDPGYHERECARLNAELAKAWAEIERLRADLVWAVRKGVMVGHYECLRPCIWFDVHRGVEYDGTDADLLRALKEASDAAMGGEG